MCYYQCCFGAFLLSTFLFILSFVISTELIHGIDTDKVNSYIEDCIAREEPLTKVLRLICIQSICNDGLKPKILDYYKREIIQVSIYFPACLYSYFARYVFCIVMFSIEITKC